MMKVRCVSMILILLLAASCTSRSGGDISDKGNIIELKTKDHEVKAIKGNVEEGTYVLFNARPMKNPDSLTYVDGKLAIMPQDDFSRFKSTYGNFRERSSEGFKAARKSLRRITVIALDGPTQDKIKKLIEQKSVGPRDSTFPVIKLKMTELRVLELKYQNKPVFLSGDVGKQYLVSKIELVKGDETL